MIPDFITHYHLPDREPFLSLSDLGGDIEHPAFVEMLNKHKENPRYRRRFGKKYLEMRKNAETKLRCLFEERGGRPLRQSPLYFILGESIWFRYLNLEHKEIRIRLCDLPHESTSVTFPDSFIAMTRDDKPYFEKVYLLNELQDIVDTHGFPEDKTPETFENYWIGDFEKYIEVQIWDDAVVEPHRRNWLCQQSGGPNPIPLRSIG